MLTSSTCVIRETMSPTSKAEETERLTPAPKNHNNNTNNILSPSQQPNSLIPQLSSVSQLNSWSQRSNQGHSLPMSTNFSVKSILQTNQQHCVRTPQTTASGPVAKLHQQRHSISSLRLARNLGTPASRIVSFHTVSPSTICTQHKDATQNRVVRGNATTSTTAVVGRNNIATAAATAGSVGVKQRRHSSVAVTRTNATPLGPTTTVASTPAHRIAPTNHSGSPTTGSWSTNGKKHQQSSSTSRRILQVSASSNSLLGSLGSSSSSTSCASSSSSSSLCATPTPYVINNKRSQQHQSQRQSLNTDTALLATPTPINVAQQSTTIVTTTQQPLEVRPFRPFKTNSEYLYAMKEDLAEWLTQLYGLDINVDNFMAKLETGALLCRHANNVNAFGRSQALAHALKKSTSASFTITSDATRSDRHTINNSYYVNSHSKHDRNGDDTDDSGNDSVNSSAAGSRHLAKSSTVGSALSSLSLYTNISTNTSKPALSSTRKDSPDGVNKSQTTNFFPNINGSRITTNNCGGGSRNSTTHYNGFAIDWHLIIDVPYRTHAQAGTFMARDNVCQFIAWCRSVHVHECLLFETDDLVLRKNERQFVFCLLEVARLGFRVGMATPTLVQFEQEIDAQLEREQQQQQLDQRSSDSRSTVNSLDDDDDDDLNNEECGPQAQIITNDLLSLHERVVELLNCCTCPTQFPMVRISDGKYKVGDKIIIFLRILRNHIMVRVGGGWDTLEHYLDKHDPCRVRERRYHQLSSPSLGVAHHNHNHAIINCQQHVIH